MSATAAKSCCAQAVYHRRQPERTLLYRVVQAYLATWLALHDDGCGGHAPALTEREFTATSNAASSPTVLPAPAAPTAVTTSSSPSSTKATGVLRATDTDFRIDWTNLAEKLAGDYGWQWAECAGILRGG